MSPYLGRKLEHRRVVTKFGNHFVVFYENVSSKIFHPLLLQSMGIGYLQWSTLCSVYFASIVFIQCVVIRILLATDNTVHPASLLSRVYVIDDSWVVHLMLHVKTNILVYNSFDNIQSLLI